MRCILCKKSVQSHVSNPIQWIKLPLKPNDLQILKVYHIKLLLFNSNLPRRAAYHVQSGKKTFRHYRMMYKMIIYGARTAEGLSISKSVYSFILFFIFLFCGYQRRPRSRKKTNLQ